MAPGTALDGRIAAMRSGPVPCPDGFFFEFHGDAPPVGHVGNLRRVDRPYQATAGVQQVDS